MKKRLLAGLLVFVLVMTTPIYASAAPAFDVDVEELYYNGSDMLESTPMRNYYADEVVIDLDEIGGADTMPPENGDGGEDNNLPDSESDETLPENGETEEDGSAPEDSETGEDEDSIPNEVDDTPSSEGSYEDLPGMPEEYSLSTQEKALKDKIITDGTLKSFGEMKAGIDFVPNQFIFLADDEAQAQEFANAYGAELISFEYGVGLAEITEVYQEKFDVEELVRISADKTNTMPPISPNHILTLYEDEAVPEEEGVNAIPNDPYIDYSSAYFQWHHETINAQSAWTVSTGNPSIKVMVIDSGVNNAHQDLTHVTALPSGASADVNGHGTHVTGIIGAQSNNGLGVGVAPDVTLISYAAPGASADSIDSYKVAAGLNVAMEQQVHVINMSFGGFFPNTIYNSLIMEGMQQGITMVVAAGNDRTDVITYPSAYSKDIVTVGNSTRANNKNHSSTTNAYLDLAAPGTSIYAPDYANNAGYVSKTGTSMASPVVTGVAALILSTYSNASVPGDLTNDGKRDIKDVRQLEKILKAATNKGVGSGLGTGIIDASKALNAVPLAPKLALDVGGDTNSTLKTFESGTGVVTLSKANPSDTIYYTLDGKNPTAATGTVYSTPITLTGLGKLTLKAIAVNGSGKASKVLSVAYTLKKTVSEMVMANVNTMGYGVSLQLAVTLTPSDPTNKKVKWSFDPAVPPPTGAKISAAGKLTIPAYKDGMANQVNVRAQAENGAGITRVFTIDLSNDPTLLTISGLENLAVGKSTTLKADVEPANIPNKKVTWSIAEEDKEFVTLTTSGKLTVKKLKETNGGVVTVTAASQAKPEILDTHNVTLFGGVVTTLALPKAASIFSAAGNDSSATTINLTEQAGYKLEAKITPFYSTLDWSSSNNAIATVDANGVVTGHAPGTATITAKTLDGSGKSAKAKITVVAPVTLVTVNAPDMGTTLTAKKSLQLKATTNGTNQKVTWEMQNPDSDKNLISLSASGKVTAKANSSGTVTVIARSVSNNTITGSVTLTLTPAAAAVTITDKVAEMFTVNIAAAPNKPRTYQFAASVGSSGVGVDWKSSNTSIASVAPDGTVTALKAGTVTITATAKDYSGKKATAKVTVMVPASDITVYPKEPGVYSAQKLVSIGKSAGFVARMGTAYGKPSSSGVTWTVEKSASTSDAVWNASKSAISISKSGVVSINKNIQYVSFTFDVRATATDGTGVSNLFNVAVMASESAMQFGRIYDVGGGFYTIDFWFKSQTGHGDFTMTISNTAVAIPDGFAYIPAYYSSTLGNNIEVHFGLLKKGSFTITMKSNTGGGSKSVTIRSS